MADVFVSYKREDAARVRKLVAALREQGLDVWWDEDIPPSAPWEATIERALREAKTVIVCWSPDAVASENVRSEARVAREAGRLIQVFMRPCSLPLFFGERQGVDLSNWRGKAGDPRIATIVDCVREAAIGERQKVSGRAERRRAVHRRLPLAVAVVLVLLGSLAGWWLLSPAKAQRPMTIAVLPFRALNPADANLVDAIWDDTRGAISRNPNLRVLGRRAVEAMADKDLEPKEYRRKIGADYLLDGSVQRAGDEVRMKVSLTRTQDGAEVWSDDVGGKLDDVFAFQSKIANEVEGRIRGRVAPGGGAKAQNIATSGEVYSLFADARAKIRQRDPESVRDGIATLKKALALDPNYAPAWAQLGVATGLSLNRRVDVGVDRQEAAAVSYLKRALQLAPNLAYAHAALAMVQNFPPELEGELHKAVALDPNDAEAWTWLGNFYALENRHPDALRARSRALEIEPLWSTTVANRLNSLIALKDKKGVVEEMARIAATGDAVLLLKARWMVAENSNKPGEAVRILLQLRSSYPAEEPWADIRMYGSLLQLGYVEEASKAAHLPTTFVTDYLGVPSSPNIIRAAYPRAIDFWLDDDAPALWGRLLPRRGRLDEYLRYYHAAFRSSDELIELDKHHPFVFVAAVPTVAAVLRQAGQGADADPLIERGEAMVTAWLRNGPATPDLLANVAKYRALDEKSDEAIALLRRAVADGWLPDRSLYAVDIADEPCFAALVNRADFQALRRDILARIEEQRRLVTPAMLIQAGLTVPKAA